MHKKVRACTVCKKEQEKPWSFTLDFEGDQYEFCSEKCREEFLLEPALFISEDEELE